MFHTCYTEVIQASKPIVKLILDDLKSSDRLHSLIFASMSDFEIVPNLQHNGIEN